MSLLPFSESSVEPTQDGELELLGVDDEQTDAVFETLSSDTARTLLVAIHTDPQTPSELADQTETSVQNVLYHLENLEDTGLVRVADTRYSEKGKEMKVYAPADNPTIVFVGTEERESKFRQLLGQLLGAVSVLMLASVVFQILIDGVPFGGQAASGGPEPGPGYPPGLAFFLGGLCLLLVVAAGWYWRERLAVLQCNSLVTGHDHTTTRYFLTATLGLSLVGGTFWFLRPVLGLESAQIGPVNVGLHGLAVVTLLAAVHAYLNGGLVVTWSIVGLPIMSFSAYGLGLILASGNYESAGAVLAMAILGGFLGALVLGTAAFIIGAGARRTLGFVHGTVVRQTSS